MKSRLTWRYRDRAARNAGLSRKSPRRSCWAKKSAAARRPIDVRGAKRLVRASAHLVRKVLYRRIEFVHRDHGLRRQKSPPGSGNEGNAKDRGGRGGLVSMVMMPSTPRCNNCVEWFSNHSGVLSQDAISRL